MRYLHISFTYNYLFTLTLWSALPLIMLIKLRLRPLFITEPKIFRIYCLIYVIFCFILFLFLRFFCKPVIFHSFLCRRFFRTANHRNIGIFVFAFWIKTFYFSFIIIWTRWSLRLLSAHYLRFFSLVQISVFLLIVGIFRNILSMINIFISVLMQLVFYWKWNLCR